MILYTFASWTARTIKAHKIATSRFFNSMSILGFTKSIL